MTRIPLRVRVRMGVFAVCICTYMYTRVCIHDKTTAPTAVRMIDKTIYNRDLNNKWRHVFSEIVCYMYALCMCVCMYVCSV